MKPATDGMDATDEQVRAREGAWIETRFARLLLSDLYEFAPARARGLKRLREGKLLGDVEFAPARARGLKRHHEPDAVSRPGSRPRGRVD